MRVLALDIATTTGAAFGRPGDAPKTWSKKFVQHTKGARLAHALKWTTQVLERAQPDFVAIEAPIKGPQRNEVLIGLAAVCQAAVIAADIPCQVFTVQDVRKHFLGKHLTTKDFPGLKSDKAKRAIKDAVIARCRSLGWGVADDNCADAAALWDLACSTFSRSHAVNTTPLFGERRDGDSKR